MPLIGVAACRPSDDDGRPGDSPCPQPHRKLDRRHWSPRRTIDVRRGRAEELWQWGKMAAQVCRRLVWYHINVLEEVALVDGETCLEAQGSAGGLSHASQALI